MAGEKHPCADGLTPECFEKYPEWAKRAFAYRLMHTLCPPRITRRLPKGLRLAYYTFPPDWTTDDPIPDGVTIDPDIVFPDDWTPGDPLPDGVTVDPGVVFPPGWTPGDPLPDGVTVDANVVFPPGWTSGDPLPHGVTVDPPANIPTPPEGAVPPLYVPPWEPGPVHRPQPPQEAELPPINGFYFAVTRGDGTVVTEAINGYFDVFNSTEGWISSTTFSYDAEIGYWKVEIDPAHNDENGYFVFIDCDDALEVQHPLRYKDDDQWQVGDLIPFGVYDSEIPWWKVTQGEGDTRDYTYPYDEENQYRWEDTLDFPAGWGTASITLDFIRSGRYNLIDNTVSSIKFTALTVKSSVPYEVCYTGEPKTAWPEGFGWLFYANGADFTDPCSYLLITSDAVEKVILTGGAGLSDTVAHDPEVAGKQHFITLEPIHEAGYKLTAIAGTVAYITLAYDP